MRVLIFFVLTLFVQSCVTYRACVDKFGTMTIDSVQVTYRDTVRVTHVLPADSAEASINLDTLCTYWRTHANRLTGETAGQRVELEWYIDAYDKVLRMRAKTKHDTVYIEKIVEGTVNCPPVVVVDPDKAAPWHSVLWKRFQLFAAWVLLAGLIFLLIYSRFKR